MNLLWWLITVESLGLIAFPLAFYLFRKFPDRGFSLAKPLGILVVSYLAWLLAALNIVPAVRTSLFLLVFLLATGSGLIAWYCRDELKNFIRRERKILISIEIIFLVFFLAWCSFRAFDPAINHTEQPMDFAFLNASIETTTGQPEDPWLRGEIVSYYYFGYWMFGIISEISSVPSNYSYNLSLALIPALGAIGLFGLVFAMVRTTSCRWRLALFSGLFAGIILGVVGNLEVVLEFMRANAIGSQGFYNWLAVDGLSGPSTVPTDSWIPHDFWWWFRATRVINTFQTGQGLDYTIQEFPFFSFMLGDLHPHVSSIPLAFLVLGFIWNTYRSQVPELNLVTVRSYVTVAMTGLSLGGLAFTNMWDLPTYAILLVAVIGMKTYSAYPSRIRPVISAITQYPMIVIALAFIFFLPYYLNFGSSVEGFGAVNTTTRYPHLLIVWGLPLLLVGPFIVGSFCQAVIGPDWRRMILYSLSVGFLPYLVWLVVRLQSGGDTDGALTRLFHILPIGLLISMGVYAAVTNVKQELSGKAFALLLGTVGLLLIMGPELLYVDDFFGFPSIRMNTVFKLYYQAWILIAAASGFAVYYCWVERQAVSGWKRSLFSIWIAGIFILMICSLYYPVAASTTKAGAFTNPTLDGLEFLNRTESAEYSAIEYIRTHVKPDEAIVEAVGEWFEWGLISRSTGVPTIFNWPGHQIQWRGSDESFKGREQDVTRIYETTDIAEAYNLLSRYAVDYVYVGPREKEKYNNAGLAKFPEFMDTAFSKYDVQIYRVRK